MDKETGEPLLVGEGEEQAQVTAEVEFTPTSPEGTVELTYTFNASALAGKSVVVFEDLYQGENVVASHADINDEGQTVTFGQPKSAPRQPLMVKRPLNLPSKSPSPTLWSTAG